LNYTRIKARARLGPHSIRLTILPMIYQNGPVVKRNPFQGTFRGLIPRAYRGPGAFRDQEPNRGHTGDLPGQKRAKGPRSLPRG